MYEYTKSSLSYALLLLLLFVVLEVARKGCMNSELMTSSGLDLLLGSKDTKENKSSIPPGIFCFVSQVSKQKKERSVRQS